MIFTIFTQTRPNRGNNSISKPGCAKNKTCLHNYIAETREFSDPENTGLRERTCPFPNHRLVTMFRQKPKPTIVPLSISLPGQLHGISKSLQMIKLLSECSLSLLSNSPLRKITWKWGIWDNFLTSAGQSWFRNSNIAIFVNFVASLPR